MDNLELFFENTRKARDEISSNPDLVRGIHETIESDLWYKNGDYNHRRGYQRLLRDKFGLKKKDNYFGALEVSVTADLYRPDLPISPFAVVVTADDDEMVYIVQDFGRVVELYDKSIVEAEFNRVVLHMAVKGYECQSIGGGGEITFGIANGKLVVHDLDCGPGHMSNYDDICDGAMFGKGEFARLAEIYARLKSPEYQLNL